MKITLTDGEFLLTATIWEFIWLRISLIMIFSYCHRSLLATIHSSIWHWMMMRFISSRLLATSWFVEFLKVLTSRILMITMTTLTLLATLLSIRDGHLSSSQTLLLVAYSSSNKLNIMGQSNMVAPYLLKGMKGY